MEEESNCSKNSSIKLDQRFKKLNTCVIQLEDTLGKGNYGVVYKAWKNSSIHTLSDFD
jgi:hypothetical protein